MMNQRRRHSRWRMFLVPLVFLVLIRHSESAPTGVSETSSTTPAARKKSLGSLSDFTWHAWLLVDTQTGGSQPGMDSATLLRRITPKSVFIAPVLPACADGYRADDMNRCVKSVDIDESAHMNFLLQRLNNIYSNLDNQQAKKQPTGPLQLNIPLIPNLEPQSMKDEMETFLVNDPIAVPHVAVPPSDDNMKTRSQEAAASSYEVKKDITLKEEKEEEEEEEKSTLLLGNSSTGDIGKPDEKPNTVVPVAEFVEETNDTSFSGVVDYKIPLIDLKTVFNESSVKRPDASGVEGEGLISTDKRDNSTEMLPTLVMLPSTKPPSATHDSPETTDDPPLVLNSTIDRTVLQMSNLTSNATKETTGINVPDPDESSPTWDSEFPAKDKDRSNETRAEDVGSGAESTKPNESRETDFTYDDEEEDVDYPYSTDMPDDESIETEGEEEILKHGETGITIPTRNLEQLYDDQQQQQEQNLTTNETKASDADDRVVIRFNDTSSADMDEAGSNVSSEVSIDGDVILETTLLDMNTERLQVTTKSPNSTEIRAVTANNEDGESGEPLDEDRSIAPEVALSPEDTRGYATDNDLPKSSERPAKIDASADENERREQSEVASATSDSLLYAPEDPVTEIYATDGNRPQVEEGAPKASSKDPDAAQRTFEEYPDVTADSFERISMNLGSAENFMRLPDQVARQGHVRFPSSQANSIHSQSYKQHLHYPADGITGDNTSTKSGAPVRQKPSAYHFAAPSWKSERQQPLEHIPTATVQRKKQQPALLRFWSKMPLVRDPAIYPGLRFPTNRSDDDQNDDRKQPRDRFRRSSTTSHRAEMMLRDDNKVLTRKRRRALTRR